VREGRQVNYYEHHLGDWAAATAHLTWDEDMAYTRLLRAYYHQEGPIAEGQQYRLARATAPAQRRAVDSVLAEFFVLVDGAFHQKRADAEIDRFRDKQRKAKASAEARWSHTERNADAMRTHSEGNALQTPDTRHQTPDTKEKTKTARKRAAPAVLVSVDDMVAEGVDRQHATDWLLNRKTKGLAPLTPSIWRETKGEAQQAGISVADAIKSAAGEGWGGFKAKWLQADGRNQSSGENKFAGAL
jgi:uncharacterized protein YdaU (DUF1376 family)